MAFKSQITKDIEKKIKKEDKKNKGKNQMSTKKTVAITVTITLVTLAVIGALLYLGYRMGVDSEHATNARIHAEAQSLASVEAPKK